ncbi:hypothetical protein SAMN05518845_11683 [Variovorax sp. YR750]|uniref:phosphoribosyltransferase-like protein n=1 Tax=Variovorax sp. YR750 TaxID=1884384 RepID=UPI0008CEF11F|nr:hypothetical protein [Variovorax sp. YR750]SEM10359.1 hypothetical protein SAMN05518845_11683 [Variovorax sp. YR750]
MRRLVVVCEEKDAAAIRQNIASQVHPSYLERFVEILTVNLESDEHTDVLYRVIDKTAPAKTPPTASTREPILCVAREVGAKYFLGSTLKKFPLTYMEHARAILLRSSDKKGQPSKAEQLVRDCGLTLRAGATESLRLWSHGAIDAQYIDRWLQQFTKLGVPWLGSSILARVHLYEQPNLGEWLLTADIPKTAALCVNRDPRSHGKSGEVVANIINKGSSGRKVFDAPANAVDEGHTEIALFEDGLWTATETVGVLESMLGLRDENRQKTKPLADPGKFKDLKLSLVYGIATDYGRALVERFLADKGLSNVEIKSGIELKVVSEDLLEGMRTGKHASADLWANGPPMEHVSPYFFQQHGIGHAGKAEQARDFCANVGRQLFVNYIEVMKQRRPDYKDWAEAKLNKCGLGMWSLGLTLAFVHSVPKASLPLLWASGPVEYKSRRLDEWLPLFPKAM